MFLNRIQNNFDKTSRIIIVQSIVISIMNYCLKVWGTTTQEQMDRVQKLENFAAKVAYGGARKYDHVTPIYKELKWLRMQDKVELDICTFTYLICNKFLPSFLFDFPRVSDSILRVTRQSSNLYIPRTRTDLGARSITCRGPKSWNRIPEYIRNSNTVSSFKERLKKYFLDK